MYTVKEIFYTIQGEGYNAGRAAVFCRFAGCNLWSGREEDREKAECNFCDTDFVGGDKFSGQVLVQTCNKIYNALNKSRQRKFVVLTGGEPMLQVDQNLIDEFHNFDFEVAIETNGTIQCVEDIDWICVSPKIGTKLEQIKGNELKLVYPQLVNPREFEELDFDHFFIQPKDGENLPGNTKACINYVMDNPIWKLSTQTHKILSIR